MIKLRPLSRWGKFFVVLIVAAWLINMLVEPNKIELEKISSPDGRWTVIVTEYIFQVSTATPVEKISIHRNMGSLVSPFSSDLLTFDQGDEGEKVRIEWKDSKNMLVHLPISAHYSTEPIISMEDLNIRYIKN